MAEVSISLGYKDAAWFAANSSFLLKEGQIVYLEQTGTYKLGDGTTLLSALTFLGTPYTLTTSEIGSVINGATTATPNDTDLVMSIDTSVAKKNTWTQIKAFLKTYFDTFYTTTSAVASQITTALLGYATQAWVTSQGYITNVITALGYTPEDAANKTSTVIGNETSTFKYITVKGVYDWVTGLFVKKGTLTANTIPKATSSDTIGDSSITDDGTIVTVNANFYANTGGAEVYASGNTAYISADQQTNTNIESNLSQNTVKHNLKNLFDAPANNFPQLTASKIISTDASKNLVSSTYSVTDLIGRRTAIGDSNYTILTTDKEIVTSATLTNNRTYTLPTGETAGQEFIVADEFQTLGTYTITVGVATGKKLNGVLNGTVTMTTTGGHSRFFGDGSGNYTFDAGIARLGVSQTFSGTNTFSAAPVLSSLTASQLLATDGSKKVQTLSTTTYPSLTELSYAKGVTSSIQTQLDSKQSIKYRSIYAYQNTDSTTTGSTSETVVANIKITGGDMGANGILHIDSAFFKSGTAGGITVNGYLSTVGTNTVGSTGNPASSQRIISYSTAASNVYSGRLLRKMVNKNSQSSNYIYSQSTNSVNDFAASLAARTAVNINTANDFWLVITITNGSAADTCGLSDVQLYIDKQ